MLRREHILVICIVVISAITFSSIISSAYGQVSLPIHRPDGIVYKVDERIQIVQHEGYSLLEGVEGQFASDSIIYGDIVNLSDDTLYYIIMQGNVYKDGKLWEKTGYQQKWTFRYDYPVEAGNPTELAISPFRTILSPGEASPFVLWPGQVGWDCYEIWIESYEMENVEKQITDEKIRKNLVIKSGKLDAKGTYKGKVFNPTEEPIRHTYAILLKYDSDNEVFGILADDVGPLSPDKAKSFTISAFTPGYPIKTHTENLLYGKPHSVEVMAWGYSEHDGRGENEFIEAHPVKLLASSNYFPNEPRPQYMNLDEIKTKAQEDRKKPIVKDFCLNPVEEKIEVSSGVTVPLWVKNNAGWWAEGQIQDSEFVTSIEYLINQRIIKLDIPESTEEEKRYESSIPEPKEQSIPVWIKNNAKWWSENKISTNEFVSGIKFLVEQGIIQTR